MWAETLPSEGGSKASEKAYWFSWNNILLAGRIQGGPIAYDFMHASVPNVGSPSWKTKYLQIRKKLKLIEVSLVVFEVESSLQKLGNGGTILSFPESYCESYEEHNHGERYDNPAELHMRRIARGLAHQTADRNLRDQCETNEIGNHECNYE